MVASGIGVVVMFELSAQYYMRYYYEDTSRDDTTWKSQPGRYLNNKLYFHEQQLARFNSFLSGAGGTGLYLLNFKYRFLRITYRLDYPLVDFLLGGLAVLLFVDFWTYSWHRLLHTKVLYKHIHRMHHKYVTPTVYSANASHPIEFIGFQLGCVWYSLRCTL